MIPVEKIIQMGWVVSLNTLERFEIQWHGHTFQIVEKNNFFALTVNDHDINVALNRSCGSKIPPASYILSGKENLLAALEQCQSLIADKESHLSSKVGRNATSNGHGGTQNPMPQTIAELQKEIDDMRQQLAAVSETEREALIKQRNGQQKLRDFLMLTEGGACIVTGISVQEVLRASHITAWKEDPKNRLVPENVLLLAAHLDALFDKHLISFDPDDGHMLINNAISDADRVSLGLSSELHIPVTGKRQDFLRKHVEVFQTKNLN